MSGFTLIELLVVISIIIVLMTLTVAGLSWFRNKAKLEATKALVLRIQAALSRYHEVFLDYPPSGGQWVGSQNLYYYLGEKLEVKRGFDPYTNEVRKESVGPLEHFLNRELNTNKYVVDIWGNPLSYKNPGVDHSSDGGKNNTSAYDLASFGPDGSPGNDDISNWGVIAAPASGSGTSSEPAPGGEELPPEP